MFTVVRENQSTKQPTRFHLFRLWNVNTLRSKLEIICSIDWNTLLRTRYLRPIPCRRTHSPRFTHPLTGQAHKNTPFRAKCAESLTIVQTIGFPNVYHNYNVRWHSFALSALRCSNNICDYLVICHRLWMIAFYFTAFVSFSVFVQWCTRYGLSSSPDRALWCDAA